MRELLILALLASPVTAQSQAACGRAGATNVARFYVEPVVAGPSDTLSARVCLAASAKGIGSYMATVTYDSTKMRAVRVATSGGMQVANFRVPGTVRLAGASPAGFASGQLATVTFVSVSARTLSRMALSVTEASTPAGASLLTETQVQSWPVSSPRSQEPPVADSVTPRNAEVSDERVTDLVVHGRNFAPSGNTILFGSAEVKDLAAENGGTSLRFTAPTWYPSSAGTPARRVTPGRVAVRVRNASGTSNAVTFVAAGAR